MANRLQDIKRRAERANEKKLRESREAVERGETVIEIPPAKIKAFRFNPRKRFDPEELESLAMSLKSGEQVQPVIVAPVNERGPHNFVLIDGERRLRAAKIAGVKLQAIVRKVKNVQEHYKLSFLANLNRVGLTPMEEARALERMYDSDELKALPNRMARIRKLMEYSGRSDCTVIQRMGLVNLHPDLQVLVEPSTPKNERMPISIAVRLSNENYPHEAQLRIWNNQLKGLTAKQMEAVLDDHAEREGRKKRRARRKPSGNFLVLQRMVNRAKSSEFFSMRNDDLAKMFKDRHVLDSREVINDLEVAIKRLQELHKRLNTVVSPMSG